MSSSVCSAGTSDVDIEDSGSVFRTSNDYDGSSSDACAYTVHLETSCYDAGTTTCYPFYFEIDTNNSLMLGL